MNNVALSIAVALAFVAAFIFGVEFGRKVEHEAVVNANAYAVAASLYDGTQNTATYSYSYTPDAYSGEDYTPDN